MSRSRSLASLLGVALAVACKAPSDGTAQDLRALTAAEVPLEDALQRFEAAAADPSRSALREEATRTLAAANGARDSLEALRVPPSLSTARREELLFLNHVIPAFQLFAAGDGGAVELSRLRSILQRGRVHQKRGRDALR